MRWQVRHGRPAWHQQFEGKPRFLERSGAAAPGRALCQELSLADPYGKLTYPSREERMEPLSVATAFATVIGLLADFRAGRSEAERVDYDEFLAWLSKSRHDELLKEIQSNQKLASGIKAAMNVTAQEFSERFDAIDMVLTQIATGLGLFNELASALRPSSKISNQAVSIVKQLVDSGAEKFVWLKVMTGEPDELILIGGNKRAIEFDDQRFLEDDLQTITELGLVRLTYGSKGTQNYHITRSAVEFAKHVEG